MLSRWSAPAGGADGNPCKLVVGGRTCWAEMRTERPSRSRGFQQNGRWTAALEMRQRAVNEKVKLGSGWSY